MSLNHNSPEYSVSELSGQVKRMVEETFGFVRVRGEISKASVNQGSGHCYLSLKDDKAVLDAVCWKGTMSKLAHKPEAGMEVIATGKLTTYPGSSKYQLVIEALEPAGIGALMAMLEARKKALEAEGLFDAKRKKHLPFLPETIGVITSPTGAVIRDILHRLADRFPRHVLLWPVAVQGQGAAEQVAKAIDGFNTMPSPPDVLIVARGGGSIEDLWAFNEEIVVRAAANSRIPIISAVGHETDTTLIDYASDRRAPTPTAAAEMAVPVLTDWQFTLEQQGQRLTHLLRTKIAHLSERIEGLARGLPQPQQLVGMMAQSLDSLAERLQISLPRYLTLQQERCQRLSDRLAPRLVAHVIERQEQRLQRFSELLESLNVLAVLKRGFSLAKMPDGHIISSAAVLADGQAFTLQFHDGERAVTTGNAAVSAATKSPKKSTPAKKIVRTQPGLFDAD